MKLSLSCLMLAASLCVATCAHASTITGTIYTGIPDWNDASDVNNMSVGAGKASGSANFIVNGGGIKYAAPPSSYTAQGYLNNVAFSGQTGTFTPTITANNIELIIMGSLDVVAGQVITITHDDGVVLFLNGVKVINSPFGTQARNDSYTVLASGTDTFMLQYAEGNGSPATLNFTVNGLTVGQTPEPSSLMLLGTGLATAAGLIRRRFVRA